MLCAIGKQGRPRYGSFVIEVAFSSAQFSAMLYIYQEIFSVRVGIIYPNKPQLHTHLDTKQTS